MAITYFCIASLLHIFFFEILKKAKYSSHPCPLCENQQKNFWNSETIKIISFIISNCMDSIQFWELCNRKWATVIYQISHIPNYHNSLDDAKIFQVTGTLTNRIVVLFGSNTLSRIYAGCSKFTPTVLKSDSGISN